MGALKGVADVKFDCKTATVSMKGDARLEAAAAEKALKDAGFGMKSIAGGPPPTLPVVRAKVADKDGKPPSAATLETVAKDLAREFPAAGEVFLEADGRLTVEGKSDGKLDSKALVAALAARGLVASEVEAREWPVPCAAYVATVKAGVRPPADASPAAARRALEATENVLAAIGRADGSWLVFTKEPCTNLATRLGEKLGPAGFDLVEVKAR